MERRRFLVWIGAALLSVTGRQAFAQRAATQRYLCTFNECDPYVYDPLHGDPDNINGDHPIPAGTAFVDLPNDWLCPVCGSPLSYFVPTDQPWSPSE